MCEQENMQSMAENCKKVITLKSCLIDGETTLSTAINLYCRNLHSDKANKMLFQQIISRSKFNFNIKNTFLT